jgi:hypothetical protein
MMIHLQKSGFVFEADTYKQAMYKIMSIAEKEKQDMFAVAIGLAELSHVFPGSYSVFRKELLKWGYDLGECEDVDLIV